MAKTKEEVAVQARERRLNITYGICIGYYDRMLASQGGVCKICNKPPTTIRLSVDHRHVNGYKKLDIREKSKEVRGLLCFTCNVLVGKLEKRNNSRQVLTGIVEYFKIHKLRGDV